MWINTNTRTDLYNKNIGLTQQRWCGADGWVVHNRDCNYGHPRPYDRCWNLDNEKGPQRSKGHSNIDDNFY